ncbi:MAG: PEGA domain-containing protein [Candidatus Sumerlaeaceae bacterium]|nr:PEGA domain-containing protein [Candidatus Sumerlaeaceae bacterium]
MKNAVRAAKVCAVMLIAALSLTGCIRKSATITSDPPGAKCWINGVYRGQTPVDVPYNWDWYYDIKLEKPGYESMTTRERFYAKPTQMVPVDLITEIAPVCDKESQWRHYTLKPKQEL